jgi:hypothetical protein
MSNVLNRTTKAYLQFVNTPDYSETDWIINPDMSAVEGTPTQYWKITGDVVAEMNDTEKEAVDDAHLQDFKDQRYVEIDAKTAEIIARGFPFGTDNYIFSLSMVSQTNIMAAFQAKDMLTYPFDWGTLDDNHSTTIDSGDTLTMFFAAALQTVQVAKFGGEAVKRVINACTTAAEVKAVVDPRE